MIIGNGMLAKSFTRYFEDKHDVIVFASGVSNSTETDIEAFFRERKMLVEALKQRKKLIYFSTCSIDDTELQNNHYVAHKKEMESIVSSSQEFIVFRLPQIVGKSINPNTLTNYLYHRIKSGDSFQVWRHAQRNLIDIDDVASICSYLVLASHHNRITLNCASPFSISILDLVGLLELIIGKKANYEIVDNGAKYSINAALAIQAADQIGVNFDEGYIEKILRKYYG